MIELTAIMANANGPTKPSRILQLQIKIITYNIKYTRLLRPRMCEIPKIPRTLSTLIHRANLHYYPGIIVLLCANDVRYPFVRYTTKLLHNFEVNVIIM